MNGEQEQQVIEFTPNFVALLHEAGFTREQAAEAVHSSLACIFAAIWKLPSTVKLTNVQQGLLLAVQVSSLNMFYGGEGASHDQ
jgi:hypothetical protein